MTPDRLNFLIEQCFLRHRREGDAARYDNLAKFLGVQPITLRRWMRGERPIPRAVEVVMEVFHEWPEVRADRLTEIIEGVAHQQTIT
jgi:hypothetical protein